MNERWAYRERGRMPMTEVLVLAKSTKPKPTRIKVRFFDDAFEGAEEWVPIGRLKTLWGEHPDFLADEERVDALHAAGSPSNTEVLLAHEVFYYTGKGNFDFITPDTNGVAKIFDLSAAEELTGLSSADLTGHPLTYLREGVLLVPWSVSRSIMIALLNRNPRVVASLIAECEAGVEGERRDFRIRHYEKFFAPTGDELEYLLARLRDESIYQPYLDLLRELVDREGTALTASTSSFARSRSNTKPS